MNKFENYRNQKEFQIPKTMKAVTLNGVGLEKPEGFRSARTPARAESTALPSRCRRSLYFDP